MNKSTVKRATEVQCDCSPVARAHDLAPHRLGRRDPSERIPTMATGRLSPCTASLRSEEEGVLNRSHIGFQVVWEIHQRLGTDQKRAGESQQTTVFPTVKPRSALSPIKASIVFGRRGAKSQSEARSLYS